jgi:hypothetical protein
MGFQWMMGCTGEPVYMCLNMILMSLDCKRDTVFSAHQPIIKLELVSCRAKKRAEKKRKVHPNDQILLLFAKCIGWNFWKPTSGK